ncbi:MAG: alpha/beta hydrolase [Duncaniella sp.]|nr:alpha/beta hydrolase [Duncaniella sp.]
MTLRHITLLLASVALSASAAGAAPGGEQLQPKANEVPRDTSFTFWSTAVKVHKTYPDAVLAMPELPKGMKEYRDVVYSTLPDTPYGKRDLHVDIFRPDTDEVLPALLMFHGGGWNSGDKTLEIPMAKMIAAQGYVTIPVEYRLIPEAVYPAGLNDAKTAVRWARANAEKYGIDPDRIAVSGTSAGAQLATLVGVTNGQPRHEGNGEWQGTPSNVQAIVSMDGIATFVSEHNIAESRQSYEKKGVLPVNSLWLGGLYEDSPANWEHASALNWITDTSAPICFINSRLDRYHDGRDHLTQIYTLRGIYSEVHTIDVNVHPFWFFHPWIDETVAHTVNFLNSILKK